MTRMPGHVDVVDRRRFSLRTSDTRIPAAAAGELEELGRVVTQLNELWADAEREAAALRERAREEGYAAGREEALGELAAGLADAQERARRFADASESRVVSIAVAVVRKILPSLADQHAVAELATDAVQSAHADPGTTVYVHPAAASSVRARLEAWARDHGGRGVPHVTGDDRLGAEDVVVESASGTIRAGLSERLEAVEGTLRKAATGVDGTGSG